MNNSVWIQYAVYGGIFIVGLIVLFFMGRARRKPISVSAIAKTEDALKRTDELLSDCEKKYNVYTVLTKTMRLTSEIGDLVVLADGEVTQNRNIAYDGVLSSYQTAAKLSGEIDITYDVEQTVTALNGVKSALENAKTLIASVNGKK